MKNQTIAKIEQDIQLIKDILRQQSQLHDILNDLIYYNLHVDDYNEIDSLIQKFKKYLNCLTKDKDE